MSSALIGIVGRGGAGRIRGMARRASELPTDPVVVLTNPDEDCSPVRVREFLDELLSAEHELGQSVALKP